MILNFKVDIINIKLQQFRFCYFIPLSIFVCFLRDKFFSQASTKMHCSISSSSEVCSDRFSFTGLLCICCTHTYLWVRDMNRKIWEFFSLVFLFWNSYNLFNIHCFLASLFWFSSEKLVKIFFRERLLLSLPHPHSCAFCEDWNHPQSNSYSGRTYLMVFLIHLSECALLIRFGLPLFMCRRMQGSSSGLISDFSLCITCLVLHIINCTRQCYNLIFSILMYFRKKWRGGKANIN